MLLKYALVAAFLVFVGCSNTPVTKTEKGDLKVYVADNDQDKAVKLAHKDATAYCKKTDSEMVVLGQRVYYDGVAVNDRSDRAKKGRRTSADEATVPEESTWQKTKRKVGSLFQSGGNLTKYEVALFFKCDH